MISIDTRSAMEGFSLIEVLVALFVLSIGLLGLAALQTTGLKLNHQSYERTQATLQAYDIIDRMRTNKSGTGDTVNTTYDNVSLGSAPGTTDCATATVPQAVMAPNWPSTTYANGIMRTPACSRKAGAPSARALLPTTPTIIRPVAPHQGPSTA